MKLALFNFVLHKKNVTIGTRGFSLICVHMSLRLQMGLEEALRNLRNYGSINASGFRFRITKSANCNYSK
jgi:hypothetical protein